jgi:hypothetical protein
VAIEMELIAGREALATQLTRVLASYGFAGPD